MYFSNSKRMKFGMTFFQTKFTWVLNYGMKSSLSWLRKLVLLSKEVCNFIFYDTYSQIQMFWMSAQGSIIYICITNTLLISTSLCMHLFVLNFYCLSYHH